jgi:tyrosinase
MSSQFVRVDVWTLAEDDPILVAYGDAVAAMRSKAEDDPTSWTFQAAMHGSLSGAPLPQWNQCRHGSWYFVSWHRAYLYYFERIVRAQVIADGGPADWALPYWNYDGVGHNALPPAFRNPTRADGSANPLFIADRADGINDGDGLPGAITTPAFALSRPSFTGVAEFGGGIASAGGQFWSQTGRLEQTPHNDVHVAVGGPGGLMSDPDTAAQDPIFWLHHANIDRLWWLWQKDHDDETDSRWLKQSFDFVDSDGLPAALDAAGVLDVGALDYVYDHRRITIPWPPIFKERPPVRWPFPWPERPIRPGPIREQAAEPPREIVGASDRPVQLTGDAVTVPVRIDRRAAQALRADPARARLPEPEHRAYVDVEDIDAARDPGVVYGVYVNLPGDPTDDDLAAHHVGNVSLFGVERARNPRGDEPGHGLRLSMEITDVLDRMAAQGTWSDGEQVEVTFRPITLQRRDAAVAPAAANHPDLPVTVGRVSVHFS